MNEPCTHPATITVTRRLGVRECVTCGAYIHEDGTIEVRGD